MESATVIESGAVAPTEAREVRSTDWSLDAILKSPAFIPALLLLGGIALVYWRLLSGLPKLWFSDDGYYSHGVLVPLIAGYVVYRWKDRLSKIPVKAGWIGGVAVVALLYVGYVATITNIQAFMSGTFLLTILAAIWFVAGARWMLALSLPVLYMVFALPAFTGAIDLYTNPMQIISTKVAFKLLEMFGFSPYSGADPTAIYLNRFVLNVAVPCSGLKLLIAVAAFTAFFMMVGGLKWWGNLVMVAIWIPLCLFINGLRIALIGVVGDTYGEAAGMQFHDYSGYITLLLCFAILFGVARGLGWKD